MERVQEKEIRKTTEEEKGEDQRIVMIDSKTQDHVKKMPFSPISQTSKMYILRNRFFS